MEASASPADHIVGYRSQVAAIFRPTTALPVDLVLGLGLLIWFAVTGAWDGVIALMLMGALSYRYFYRYGYRMELEGTTVTWWSWVSKRTFDITDLVSNAPTAASGFDRFTTRGGERFVIMSSDKSWAKFLAALNDAHPDHPFVTTPRLRWPTLIAGYYEGSAPSGPSASA